MFEVNNGVAKIDGSRGKYDGVNTKVKYQIHRLDMDATLLRTIIHM